MNEWIKIAWHTSKIYDFPSDLEEFLKEYKTFDLIIPVFHGIYGEDGQITAFLKTLGCKYTYSSFTTHALCLDKYRTNLFIKEMGIKIPETIFMEKWGILPIINIEFPLIIKANQGWSSIAISKAKNNDEILGAIEKITNDDILIQEYIEWREFTVWVYKNTSGYHTLPIIEIKTLSQDFFDYEEKYETDGSNEVFLDWEYELQKILINESIRIANLLECSGVVRMDYRYDGKDIYFLEVNTIPGFTSGSLVPKMWKKAGKNEKEFIEMLYCSR